MKNDIFQLVNFLKAQIGVVSSPDFLFYLKIGFLTISILFVVGVFILLFKNTWLKNKYIEDLVELYTFRPYGVQKTFKQWGKIAKRVEGGKEGDYRMAIIEADSLLIEVLKRMNYKGEKVNDLLDQVDSKVLPNVDRIKAAHEFRNNIVHDPSYDLSLDETKTVIGTYEQTFRDLQMF